MSKITIRTSSICDKAGRSYNQDNFWLCPDLSYYQATNSVILEEQDSDVSLLDKGALLAVADGMGGMNAGEVASQIIIDSINLINRNTETYNSALTVTQSDVKKITWYGFITDEAGNATTCNSGQFKVDTTKPTCSVSFSGTNGNNGWYKSGVSVTLNSSDNGVVLKRNNVSK